MTSHSIPPEFARVIAALRDAHVGLRQVHSDVDVEFFLYDLASRGGTSVDTMLGIDIGFREGPSAEYGGVALLIAVRDSRTTPMVDFAGLAWCAPYPDEEAVVVDEATPVSKELVGKLEAALPTLLSELSMAVVRGIPPTLRGATVSDENGGNDGEPHGT